jgi:hypothetical protein
MEHDRNADAQCGEAVADRIIEAVVKGDHPYAVTSFTGQCLNELLSQL